MGPSLQSLNLSVRLQREELQTREITSRKKLKQVYRASNNNLKVMVMRLQKQVLRFSG